MSEEKITAASSATAVAKTAVGTKVAIGVLGTAVCGLSVALAISMTSPKTEEKDTVTDGRATFISKENVEEVKQEMEAPVEDAYYTTSMTIDWNFYDGKSVSTNAYVANITANKRTVYFDVNLSETGELVYSSPYLPVGERMEEIALDKELPKGDYPAIITYHLVDDNHEELTTVSVAITLHILN